MFDFFSQYNFLKNQSDDYYREMTGLCEVLELGPGDILMVTLNIFFVVKGMINIKNKRSKIIIGSLGPGSLICDESLLDQYDIHFRPTKMSFFETCEEDTVVIKMKNADHMNMQTEYKKQRML